MSYEKRKNFLEQMSQLSRTELEEIFRIIRRHNDIFSENTNGIFFDVSALKEETFTAMYEFMEFCMKNREEQNARVAEMQSIHNEMTRALYEA
jgi:hypothetical protein